MITSYNEDYSLAIVLDDEELPTKMMRILNCNPSTGEAFDSSIQFQMFVEEMAKKDFLFESYQTEEQIKESVGNNLAEEHRKNRDVLLAKSDWTHSVDAPLSEERKFAWAAYRQALRDITQHESFPFLKDSHWPVEP